MGLPSKGVHVLSCSLIARLADLRRQCRLFSWSIGAVLVFNLWGRGNFCQLAVNQTVVSPAVRQSRLQDYLQEPGESLRLPLRHSVPDARQLPAKVADAAPTHLTAVEPAHRSEAQSAIGIETVAAEDVWRAAVEREYTAYWNGGKCSRHHGSPGVAAW